MVNRILLLACIALLGCFLFVGARAQSPAPVTRWEYRIIKGPTEKQLNQLGDQGWELERVVTYSPYLLVFMKRPK